MAISTVSSKGQITLPASARKQLGIRAHDRVSIDATGDTIVVTRVKDFFELEGFLGKGVPLQEARKKMMKAVAAHVKGDDT